MSDQQPQKPTSHLKTLLTGPPLQVLPVGVLLAALSVCAFVFFEVHVVSGLIAAAAGILGVVLILVSLFRLLRGRR